MMNIKILNPIPESEVLMTIPFGSRVYGTADEIYSDKDFVKILKQDTGSLILQYTTPEWIAEIEQSYDYIYTSMSNFLKQALDGSNVVFFECMISEAGREFFGPGERDFDYPRIAKAYLGLAKRDLDYPERAHHVRRCYWMATKILNNEPINLQDVKFIPDTPVTLDQIQTLRKSIKYNE